MSEAQRPYLTEEQVFELNEKHGWFQYRDAQGDVSRAFAQDAIETYERVRRAAPEMLEALEATNLLLKTKRHACESNEVCAILDRHIARNNAAIAKARGTA